MDTSQMCWPNPLDLTSTVDISSRADEAKSYFLSHGWDTEYMTTYQKMIDGKPVTIAYRIAALRRKG